MKNILSVESYNRCILTRINTFMFEVLKVHPVYPINYRTKWTNLKYHNTMAGKNTNISRVSIDSNHSL